MTDNAHRPVVDPVTGYETTGHEWNGIIELNTPFPRIVIWALAVSFVISAAMWVLLPAWPTGRDYTRGLLGLEQGKEAEADYRELAGHRESWRRRFVAQDFASLASDRELMAVAMPAAARLFSDNCAACHGRDGHGGTGFPSLAGPAYLWGGDPATIAETVTVGINSADPDTRVSQMPAFGRDGMLKPDQMEAVADYVVSLAAGKPAASGSSAGAQIFADNCAACHGEGGRGGLGVGAPPLTSHRWIYGGTRSEILATLQNGRQGLMPTWKRRLDTADIHMLSIYVSRLGRAGRAPVAP